MERTSSQESLETPEVVFEKTALKGPVGFNTITSQIEAKSLKRGFDFNILVTGQTGLGKTTLVNTLFSAHLVDSKKSASPADPPRKTTEISSRSHLVEENGVKLRLRIVDSPGFAEQLNNSKCWEPIVDFIQAQHSLFEKEESAISRKKAIPDSRIHACLYFIAPHGILKPIDIEAMKNIAEVVNLIPVIAKSDSMTLEEREDFKRKLNDEFRLHKIKIYPNDYSGFDAEEAAANAKITSLIPFAVVGSEKTVTVDGKTFPARSLGWSTINIENPDHCEFSQLRSFLMKTHMQDLIETTRFVHYESFRGSNQKKSKKKSKD